MSDIFNEYKECFHESWHPKIRKFIESPEFQYIITTLRADASRGKVVLPKGKSVIFKAFKLCSLDDLKVVFMGLSPYYQVGVADGLAFSCGNTMKEQPSLKLVLNAVEDDLGIQWEKREVDLSRWAQSGVLLTNLALTTQEGKADKYVELWRPFWDFVYREIFNTCNGLIFVYFGAEAKKLQKLETPFIHYSKSVEHPAYSARQNREFYHENLFSWCNTLLRINNGESFQIPWIPYTEDLPF